LIELLVKCKNSRT